MDHIPENIKYIADRIFRGEATAAEQEEFNQWYHSFCETEVLVNEEEAVVGDRIHQKLATAVRGEGSKKYWHIYWKSAAVLLLLSAVLLRYPGFKTTAESVTTQKASAAATAIKPGTNKAVLILADGQQLALDQRQDGVLSNQGNTEIVKLNEGLLQYKGLGNNPSNVVLYNTIVTPRGGQYQVQLSDGTKVWLNASSSLRFPTAFTGGERSVELTGEAYMEVTSNPSNPFWVKLNGTEIKVLGTRFNVMAYEEEGMIATTLIEGSLQVQHDKKWETLQPGNQLRFNASGQMQWVKNADVEEVIAWKNGKFVFNAADINSIMRQVERWYNVEVEMDADLQIRLSGQLNRFADVNELLRKLELTNEVYFIIDQRKIIVRKGTRH